MNNKSSKIGSLIILATLVTISETWAQRPSPADSAKGKIGGANVTINYSSPGVKGRKIWGDLVPYDKAWRAGANEATTITTDKAIKVEGKDLPAGKYTVFAIPGEKEWQIIFNSQVGQWGIKRSGEANYDPANNVAVVTVKPKKSAQMNERLKYEVNGKGIVLKWENLEVPIAAR
jgi:hypothetical protein